MTEIIIVCFIVGLALIMTARWARKKVIGEGGSCCTGDTSSKSSCGCNSENRGSITNKPIDSIDWSFPRKKG